MVWTTSLLVLFTLTGTSIGSNIIQVKLPVNLTSLRASLAETFNHSLIRPLASRFVSSVNNTLAFMRNGSFSCTPQGGKCFPGIPSCCPGFSSQDDDLQCLPRGHVHVCERLTDAEDQAQERLTELEYGDSMGHLESHAWVNSWEFQSRSEAEKEEMKDFEEAQWKKQWKPSNIDNLWVRTYKKMKSEANNLWNDLRKMKKLKEIKESLLDKQKKRLDPTKLSPEIVKPKPSSGGIVYPDELSEETDLKDKTLTKSEESIIKFSDEIPKPEKKINFRLDDIVKDAIDLAAKQLKKKTKNPPKPTERLEPPLISSSSDEAPLHLDEIEETENKLRQQLDELRKHKLKKLNNKEARGDGTLSVNVKPSSSKEDELIKKHVRNVLEEERNLEKAKKLMELKQWETQPT